MQLSSLLASVVIIVVPVLGQVASTGISTVPSTTSTPTGTTTDIARLVSQLPTCALSCLESAATAINCTTSDLPCLCSQSDSLASNIGPCILFSSCSSDDQSKLIASAQSICANINNAQPAQIASASSYIASAVASDTPSTASGNFARRTDAPVAGMGFMGAAAALAMLAL